LVAVIGDSRERRRDEAYRDVVIAIAHFDADPMLAELARSHPATVLGLLHERHES
jgi:predicted Zn-dependent protease with MMP-like domain